MQQGRPWAIPCFHVPRSGGTSCSPMWIFQLSLGKAGMLHCCLQTVLQNSSSFAFTEVETCHKVLECALKHNQLQKAMDMQHILCGRCSRQFLSGVGFSTRGYSCRRKRCRLCMTECLLFILWFLSIESSKVSI